MKHLVQDFDGDGQFDNYFHLKAMAIVGNVAGNRVEQGGAQRLGELVGPGPGQRREPRHLLARTSSPDRYREHIDYWYENFPADRNLNGTPTA